MQAQEAEQAGGLGGEGVEGPGEHGAHGDVAGGEDVEALVDVRQILGETFEGQVSAGRDAFGCDPHRQGEAPAEFDDAVGGCGVGVDACGADDLPQQCEGVGVVERVDGQAAGAVAYGQGGQALSAGDQDQAAGGGWDERGDLFRAGCVVQDEQGA
nr:hypothetical protein [Saccharothrix syringae]